MKLVDTERGESLLGHYAGGVTRLVAFVLDETIAIGVFAIVAAVMTWLIDFFTSQNLSLSRGNLLWLIAMGIWQFIYFWYCWSLSGKTPGMALVGLRVVRSDGADLPPRRCAVRVIVLPLSFAFFGLGFLGIIFGREHKAWHDHVANSAVVYDFDARAARLRFLMRHPAGDRARAA